MGTTILDFWLQRLEAMGFERIAVNAHHLSSQISDAVMNGGLRIPTRVFVEDLLLGTAGGMRNALEYFEGQDFAVVNGDTLCDANLGSLMVQHLRSGEPATLVLHNCAEFNNVAVRGGDDRIVGFGEEARRMARERSDIRLLAFTGIHFLNPGVLESLESGIPADIVSIYRNLILEGRPPQAMVMQDLLWREMGTVESYRALNAECSRWPADLMPPLRSGDPLVLHPTCEVARDVRFKGFVAAGRGCRVLKGASLEDSVLWNDVEIREGSFLKGCIVTDGASVAGSFLGQVITAGSP
jgi:mannose-1-phosphate guanylyltransferase